MLFLTSNSSKKSCIIGSIPIWTFFQNADIKVLRQAVYAEITSQATQTTTTSKMGLKTSDLSHTITVGSDDDSLQPRSYDSHDTSVNSVIVVGDPEIQKNNLTNQRRLLPTSGDRGRSNEDITLLPGNQNAQPRQTDGHLVLMPNESATLFSKENPVLSIRQKLALKRHRDNEQHVCKKAKNIPSQSSQRPSSQGQSSQDAKAVLRAALLRGRYKTDGKEKKIYAGSCLWYKDLQQRHYICIINILT